MLDSLDPPTFPSAVCSDFFALSSVDYDTVHRTKLKNVVLFPTIHDSSRPFLTIPVFSHTFIDYHVHSRPFLTVPDHS